MSPLPELLTAAEAAAHLRVTAKTLYNWRLQGIGPPSIKFGGALRYRADELAGWIEAGAPMDQPAA